MSISATIRGRRSIRCFNDRMVPTDVILGILNDAIWAPNHGLREPWRFIYVEKLEAREKMADLMFEAGSHLKRLKLLPEKLKQVMKRKIVQIPANLIVVMKQDSNAHKQEEDFAAVCCLMQNIQLLGWEQGIGMIWSSIEFIYSPIFYEGMGVKSGERVVGVLHMGYFDKTPKPGTRTPADKKLTVM